MTFWAIPAQNDSPTFWEKRYSMVNVAATKPMVEPHAFRAEVPKIYPARLSCDRSHAGRVVGVPK